MLFAEQLRVRPNGVLDLAGVFDRVTVHRKPFMAPITVVAKVVPDPITAGTVTEFTLRISAVEGGDTAMANLRYEHPTFDQWLRGAAPYVSISLADFEFPRTGEYAVELIYEQEVVARETFFLRYEEAVMPRTPDGGYRLDDSSVSLEAARRFYSKGDEEAEKAHDEAAAKRQQPLQVRRPRRRKK